MSAAPITTPSSASVKGLASKPHIPVALSRWSDVWKPPPQEKPPIQGSVETWREVIDTIVFVVVLVLVLKSFVAECFVIPTGSMAETLLGYHKVVDCPSCGLNYTVNCSQEVEHPETGQKTINACCPNCLEKVALRNPATRAGFEFTKQVPDPGPTTGDRVLVSKFFQDLLGIPFQRWDVVVFKYPGNSNPIENGMFNPPFPLSGPQKEHTAMNYIKRLVGLPGETLAIHGGDLYQMKGFEPPRDQPPVKDIELWMYPNMHVNFAVKDFHEGKFEILRKPPHAVLAESRLVYDHNHPPADLTSIPRWQAPGGGVDADGVSAFVVREPKAEQTTWLRYQHLLRGVVDPTTNTPKKQLITDLMGYNYISDGPNARGYGNNWVNDLILEAQIQPQNGQGTLVGELSRGSDRFQARLDLGKKTLELVRITAKGNETLSSLPIQASLQGSFHFRFANVDRALHVWVNNRPITGNGVAFDSPQTVLPDVVNDLEPVSLGFSGMGARVSSIKVSRDSYYTVGDGKGIERDVSVSDWTAGQDPTARKLPAAWLEIQNLPVKTLFVQPGHYLCMGDNSSHSSDSRAWGLVPHRLMLGQAVAVYFPISRAGKIR